MTTVFDTVQIYNPDYSYEDLMAESERLIQRQKAIQVFLSGELPPDVVLDMLEEHGIDAAIYTEQIADLLQL